jgi:ABC-type transport system substrate-binding protein
MSPTFRFLGLVAMTFALGIAGTASHAQEDVVLYTHLATKDPYWRELLRDQRFRRAMSLAIDRQVINRMVSGARP